MAPPDDCDQNRGCMPVMVLNVRMDTLHSDITEIKDVLKSLTAAVTKLALIEERQTHATFKLDKIDERLSQLEERAPITDRTNIWVERFLISAFTVAAMMVVEVVLGVVR